MRVLEKVTCNDAGVVEEPAGLPVTWGEIVGALRKFAEGEHDEYKHLIFTTAADKIERMVEAFSA